MASTRQAIALAELSSTLFHYKSNTISSFPFLESLSQVNDMKKHDDQTPPHCVVVEGLLRQHKIWSKWKCVEDSVRVSKAMNQHGIFLSSNQAYCLLKECTNRQNLERGRQVQALMVLNGLDVIAFLADHLIRLFATCGSLIEANQAFTKIENPSGYTWSAIVNTHAKLARNNVTLQLYLKMLLLSGPINDKHICVAVLKGRLMTPELRFIHEHIIGYGLHSDLIVGNSLVDMYARCNQLDEAFNVFRVLPDRNVVSWSSMIAGFTKNDEEVLALECFKWMQEEHIAPNELTYSSLLKACANKRDIEWTRYAHEQIITVGVQSNVIVGSVLVDAYCKCGCLQEACQVFENLPERNVVTWGAMIDGYAKLGEVSLALDCHKKMQQQCIKANAVIFSIIINVYAQCGNYLQAMQMCNEMKHEDLKLDKLTFLSILKACCNVGAIEEGRRIHEEVIKCGFHLDPMIGSALTDMYARYGNLREAQRVFEILPARDVVSWNTLLAGHARQGSVSTARDCLSHMMLEGIKPDDATFISILAACSHAGIVDEGQGYFKSMRMDYNLIPDIRHYSCMVDLLARAGYLIQAYELLQVIQADMIGWKSLLTACRTYGNVELGRHCFHQVVLLDSHDAAGYVVMSGIYSDACMWKLASEIDHIRQSCSAWKKPAKAWIEVDNIVHEFIVGDKSHPQCNEIYTMLKALSDRMRKGGYMPKADYTSGKQSVEEMEDALCGHCEKLAIAFGLISTPPGTTIRATKNLRVCMDCHNATKIISKLEHREIIIIDGYRMHHFKDGSCSCGDYY